MGSHRAVTSLTSADLASGLHRKDEYLAMSLLTGVDSVDDSLDNRFAGYVGDDTQTPLLVVVRSAHVEKLRNV